MKLLIYEVRSEKGISARALSKMTKISESTLNRYERYGNEHIDIKILEIIAESLDCRITDLFESQVK